MAFRFGFFRSGDKDGRRQPGRAFTARLLPNVPESAPTFSREGHHVIVEGGGARLARDFVSSHKTKEARAL